MKITMMEELESHKAFRHRDRCPNCGGTKYTIHHILPRFATEAWWIECDTCGYETDETSTKEEAFTLWRN